MSFNPEMLQVAREAEGMTQAGLALAAGLSQSLISKIENGLTEPDAEAVAALGKAVRRPAAFFSQSERIYRGGLSDFYHRKRSTAPKRALNKIHAEANVLRMQVVRLLSAVEVTADLRVPDFDPDEFDSVEDVARAVRAAWRLPSGPIENLVSTLESAGVLVVTRPMATRKLDAVTQWDRDTALIILNSASPASRCRWTLAHELGHLVMHRTPVDPTRAEAEADQFASEFLMPSDDIAPHLRQQYLTVERATSLKQHWRVSIAAIARKANGMGFLSDRQLRSFYMRLNQLGYRKDEPGEFSPEEPTLLNSLVTALVGEEWTVSELSDLLVASESEVRANYLGQSTTHLRVINPRQIGSGSPDR